MTDYINKRRHILREHAAEMTLENAVDDGEPIRMVRGVVKIGETGYHTYYYKHRQIEPTEALGPYDRFRVRTGVVASGPLRRSTFKYFATLTKAKAWIDAIQ
tara:strand:+ start:66 stop:371 length:306 start_codon:yes stop_codon:yes gene_type:complete